MEALHHCKCQTNLSKQNSALIFVNQQPWQVSDEIMPVTEHRISEDRTFSWFDTVSNVWVCSCPAAECKHCATRMAKYYCKICRLWDNEDNRSIYHCPFCNLCRRGKGLGIDACHCMHCNACMHLSEFKQHTCRDLHACPICTESLFDSNQPYRVSPLSATCHRFQNKDPLCPPNHWCKNFGIINKTLNSTISYCFKANSWQFQLSWWPSWLPILSRKRIAHQASA